MGVTLERRAGGWPALLIGVGLAGIAIASLAYYTTPRKSPPPEPGPKPDDKIHVPLFVDPNQVTPTPRFRFTFDPPSALVNLRTEEGIDAVVAGATDDLDRCRKLMHWTRQQWEPGIPNPYPPLDARVILRDIRRRFTGGFCAQYNYVLAQSLQSLGIPARYVSLVEHEVIEARLTDRARWVCFDPLYDAYYMDDAGTPLSVYEIHRRAAAGQPVAPSEGNLIPDLAVHLKTFASFAVWLKNDHITAPLNFVDLERYKVYYIDDPAMAATAPPGALTTTVPVDLYPG